MRPRALVLLAVVVLLAACRSAEPVRIRVLSYNIRHGRGADGRIDLERTAAVIRRLDPDLVALQEVDRGTRRSAGVDQAAEIGRLTGLHAWFGKAMDYAGGGYGEAVLSRWPALTVRTIALPHGSGREPRAALVVEVVPPGGEEPVRFVGTHLDHVKEPTDRVAQARALRAALARGDMPPTVLVGDLNAEPGSEPMRVLLESFADASAGDPRPTYPAADPEKRIDYVLLRPPARWRVVESRVVTEPEASDHAPLLIVLELRPVSRDRGDS